MWVVEWNCAARSIEAARALQVDLPMGGKQI